MSSLRERVIVAVAALAKAALPYADHERNRDKGDRIGPGGTVIVRDGEPGEPEVTLSPISYTYQHRVDLDVAAYATEVDGREAALDAMLVDLGAAVEADRSLGGLCEWVEVTAPDLDDVKATGAESIRWAELSVVCVYTTPSPLA